MADKLFLLDGMALAYRAHFAFISRPIYNSRQMNTSAVYGFTNTLVELLEKQEPTHIAIVYDTHAPTARHELFPEYKGTRQEQPEDLALAFPYLDRLADCFRVPVLRLDGYEADDIIGTLAWRAAEEGMEVYMVTPDKDFGQLVRERVYIYKPGYKGEAAEILGVDEVLKRWEIKRVEQVCDMLGLAGDTVDNIPGVPGIGPKTAQKLIAQFHSVEELVARAGELKGSVKDKMLQFGEQAILSKKLATIDCAVPIDANPHDLIRKELDRGGLTALFQELEFRTLGKRLLGPGYDVAAAPPPVASAPRRRAAAPTAEGQMDFLDFGETEEAIAEGLIEGEGEGLSQDELPGLSTLACFDGLDPRPDYRHVRTTEEIVTLAAELAKQKAFCFDVETDGLDPRHATLIGIAISFGKGTGYFVWTGAEFGKAEDHERAQRLLVPLQAPFADAGIEKIGHNLKFDIHVLSRYGFATTGPFFDTMLAHTLAEPERKHGMDFLSETYLAYRPISITSLIGEKGPAQLTMSQVEPDLLRDYAAEDADVTWQLAGKFRPLLTEMAQDRVYTTVEAKLIPVLVAMEQHGICVDVNALAEFSTQLESQANELQEKIWEQAGQEFNLNSPQQLGRILFEDLKLLEKPKKTATGQYATHEQVLVRLTGKHPLVQNILDYRAVVKLKSTYVDTLPGEVDPTTGRVHTTYGQLHTVTGRLQSAGPNLQNIPIRTELGQEIRKAFIAKDEGHLLLSADYSQIELRIIAALSGDAAMQDAFARAADIHTATAAKIFNVAPEEVTREMRSKAKMVNFGIPYGISSFGLAERLNIPKREAGDIIAAYFAQFSGIRGYIDSTMEFARTNGYVETVTGRRRYLRDINSRNWTTRGGAERNAINMPIQGTAADMIKIAMAGIHAELAARQMATRLLLQVHDELVLEVPVAEREEAAALVEAQMRNALPLSVPFEVETGFGKNWLEAH